MTNRNPETDSPYNNSALQPGKAAVASKSIQGEVGGLVSAIWLAYTSYQATGTLSEPVFIGLVSSIAFFLWGVYGRVTAKQPIRSWF